MARRVPKKYTPEQEIITLRAKGEITHQQATRRLRALSEEKETKEKETKAKASRGILKRVLDFMTP